MKLSELKPCDICKGEGKNGKLEPIFFTLHITRHLVDMQAANTTLALTSMYGGSVAMAEAMTPTPEATQEVDAAALIVCHDCFLELDGAKLAHAYFEKVGSGDGHE